MNFIYLGSSCPESVEQELMKLGARMDFAGHTLQNALLDGFSHIVPKLNIITSWGITNFPKVKKICFGRRVMSYGKEKNNYIYVGAFNLPLLDKLYRYFKVKRELKRMLKKDEDNVLVIYGVQSPFLLAATALRKKFKHINVIVPDLPEFMSGNKRKLHLLLKSIDYKIITHCLKKIDSYSLLSEPMRERLPMEGKKWCLMEGIYQPTEDPILAEKDANKVVMYTGGIYHRRGTDLLLDAFKLIDNPDYRLWIRGNGDMKDEILEMAKKDSRIVYFEPVPRLELLKMERQATCMINPTMPSLDFTRYFFPSKTMEYLASGTPTIMFHLGCMPKEYDEHLFYIEDETPESMRDKIVEVCEMNKEDLAEFGRKAREFVLFDKTPQKQCQKIFELCRQ